MDVDSPTQIADGDVVVVVPAERSGCHRHGAALLVTSNGTAPSEDVLALARESGTAVVSSPLDTYMSPA